MHAPLSALAFILTGWLLRHPISGVFLTSRISVDGINGRICIYTVVIVFPLEEEYSPLRDIFCIYPVIAGRSSIGSVLVQPNSTGFSSTMSIMPASLLSL